LYCFGFTSETDNEPTPLLYEKVGHWLTVDWSKADHGRGKRPEEAGEQPATGHLRIAGKFDEHNWLAEQTDRKRGTLNDD
jgi:hypothetical protein